MIIKIQVTVVKMVEDGGTTVAGTLISTTITIIHGMAPSTLLALGIIPGGLR